MNPDHDSKPLLDDVLQGDYDTMRAASLEQLLTESRRAKRTRQNIRRSVVVAAVLVIAGIGLFVPHDAHNDIGAKPQPTGDRTINRTTVRQLTDVELQQRLEKFAVAYVGGAANKRIVMIEPRTP